MTHTLQVVLYGVGFALQALLLTALVVNFQRRFVPLFLYTISLFLTTVAELALQESGRIPTDYQGLYWSLELIRQAFLYNVVLSLVFQAVESNPAKRFRVVGMLATLSGSYWAFCLWFFRAERFNLWMTQSVQWISFGAAALNLLLWATLVGKRHRNRILLAISGAYGMQTAGEAIGQSLRMLAVSSRSAALVWTGNMVLILAHFLCLFVWWRTVLRAPREPVLAPGRAAAFDPDRPRE